MSGATPPCGKAAQGQATRASLLDAARTLFGQRGYAATSTEDVVAAAGVTKGAVVLRGALRKAMVAGVIERVPLRPLALLLTGALSEACFYVSDADDPVAARDEVRALVEDLVEAFRVDDVSDRRGTR